MESSAVSCQLRFCDGLASASCCKTNFQTDRELAGKARFSGPSDFFLANPNYFQTDACGIYIVYPTPGDFNRFRMQLSVRERERRVGGERLKKTKPPLR